MSDLSYQQLWVLHFLAGAHHGQHVSPTEIGRAYKGSYFGSSAWASTKLKSLAGRGLVTRNDRGHWALTDTGREVVRGTKERARNEAVDRCGQTNTSSRDYTQRGAIFDALAPFLSDEAVRKKAAAAVLRVLKSLP